MTEEDWNRSLRSWSHPNSRRKLTRIEDFDPPVRDDKPVVTLRVPGKPEYALGLTLLSPEMPVVTYPGGVDVAYDFDGRLVAFGVPLESRATLHYTWIDPSVDTHVPAVIAQEDESPGCRCRNLCDCEPIRKGDVLCAATTDPHAGLKFIEVPLGDPGTRGAAEDQSAREARGHRFRVSGPPDPVSEP